MIAAKILVACHKPYWVPEDPLYIPIHAGKALASQSLPFLGDNEGDSISDLNPNFCELTALYWGWKNLDCPYLGLCHYRRYFTVSLFKSKKSRILTSSQLEELLKISPVILPKKRHYWIETNYSHYIHAHHKEDLDLTRSILLDRWPDYVDSFDEIMSRTSGHRFNMFIMRRDLLNAYCDWLFDVLMELHRQLDISTYSLYDARVFGFVGERLLDVWLHKNKISFLDIPYVYLEKQNWLVKIFNFAKRKFIHKR